MIKKQRKKLIEEIRSLLSKFLLFFSPASALSALPEWKPDYLNGSATEQVLSYSYVEAYRVQKEAAWKRLKKYASISFIMSLTVIIADLLMTELFIIAPITVVTLLAFGAVKIKKWREAKRSHLEVLPDYNEAVKEWSILWEAIHADIAKRTTFEAILTHPWWYFSSDVKIPELAEFWSEYERLEKVSPELTPETEMMESAVKLNALHASIEEIDTTLSLVNFGAKSERRQLHKIMEGADLMESESAEGLLRRSRKDRLHEKISNKLEKEAMVLS